MDTILLWIVTILYTGQAAVSVYNGQLYHAMIVFGYAFANVGLILSMQKLGG